MPYEVKEPSEALPMNLNLTSCGQTFVVKLGAVSDKTLSRLKGPNGIPIGRERVVRCRLATSWAVY
jgi:hypothetical protein